MKIKRKLFAIAAMVLCVGSFTGCAKQNAEDVLDAEMSASIAMGSENILEELASYDAAYISSMIEQYEDSDNKTMADSLDAWLTTMEEVGGFVQVNGSSAELKDNQYVATIDATFEKRPMSVTFIYDKKGIITSMEFAPEYSLGENMSRAAVHTIIGMGTVFLVLIFISLIIGCFKYINAWEKKLNAKNAPAAPAPAPALAATPAAAAVEEEEELADDLELVAVITAAIAASMNTSTDGLVVRSIKRKSGAKWKRA
ncbi:MAG: OadG family transporter subunit [Lachnospiraceae bacterium]|nr:OadG family transporter subunit [Lachnospiraceae bacterium]